MEYEVTLKVDGKDIALNPFVSRIFSGVCRGLVESLDRLPEEQDRLELILTRTDPRNHEEG